MKLRCRFRDDEFARVVEFARVMFAFMVGGAKRWRRNGRAGYLLRLPFVK